MPRHRSSKIAAYGGTAKQCPAAWPRVFPAVEVAYWQLPESSSYRQRRHLRVAGYDYHTPGYYFVTLCTENCLPLFGSIEEGTMHLSAAGAMVEQTWQDLLALHPGITVDTQVTMPDHIHAIVVLEDDPLRTLSLSDVVQRYKSLTTKRYAHGVGGRDGHASPARSGKRGFTIG